MATLEQLVALPGVLASFEFHGNGQLLAHQCVNERLINIDTLKLLSHMCAANINIAAMQARGWDAQPETEGFFPVRTFTLVGLEWSVIVGGAPEQNDSGGTAPFIAVVLANDGGDYESVFGALER